MIEAYCTKCKKKVNVTEDIVEKPNPKRNIKYVKGKCPDCGGTAVTIVSMKK